jgi:Xaa-Pro aminopeptidase
MNLVASLRLFKHESELATIRKAVRVQEQALLALLPTIKAGQTELEIAARLEAEMKSRGSSAPSFETIIAADATGSLPHYRPKARKVRRNKSLLIDWGATYNGYISDMTRTFALGSWPKTMREIYLITLEAQEAAAAAIAPGKTNREIDAVARDIITRAGYGEQFGHGTGHGFGMAGKEEPYISHLVGEQVLQPGMVFTIEPGIYLPGVGGVRIEDDYVVTERGSKNLCTLPKTLEWSTLK